MSGGGGWVGGYIPEAQDAPGGGWHMSGGEWVGGYTPEAQGKQPHTILILYIYIFGMLSIILALRVPIVINNNSDKNTSTEVVKKRSSSSSSKGVQE